MISTATSAPTGNAVQPITRKLLLAAQVISRSLLQHTDDRWPLAATPRDSDPREFNSKVRPLVRPFIPSTAKPSESASWYGQAVTPQRQAAAPDAGRGSQAQTTGSDPRASALRGLRGMRPVPDTQRSAALAVHPGEFTIPGLVDTLPISQPASGFRRHVRQTSDAKMVQQPAPTADAGVGNLPLRSAEYARVVETKYNKPKKDYAWYKEDLRAEKDSKDYKKIEEEYPKELKLGDRCGDSVGPYKDAKCKNSVCVLIAPVRLDANARSMTDGNAANDEGEYRCTPTGCFGSMPKCNGDNTGALSARRAAVKQPALPFDGAVGDFGGFNVRVVQDDRFTTSLFAVALLGPAQQVPAVGR